MAQTNTTLSSAMTATQNSAVVASATGFAAGSKVLINGEWMEVAKDYVSGTTIPLLRGRDSTPSIAHDTSSKVVVGLGSDFPSNKRIGFESGSGTTVTQITSRATGVTIHAMTGQITTDSTSLAAEAGADFVVTNAFVAENDVVAISVRSGVVAAGTQVSVIAVGDGQFTIRTFNGNVAAGAAETGAIVISFAVIKGQRA